GHGGEHRGGRDAHRSDVEMGGELRHDPRCFHCTGRPRETERRAPPSIRGRSVPGMKPVQILLLVAAGALGGAVLTTKVWHKPQPVNEIAAVPTPAPVAPLPV